MAKLTVAEAHRDLLRVAQMVVDWYEGRVYNGPDERRAIYEAAKKALPKKSAAIFWKEDERGPGRKR